MKCASIYKGASSGCSVTEELKRIDALLEILHSREQIIERARSDYSAYNLSLNEIEQRMVHKTTPSYNHQPSSYAHGNMQLQLLAPSKAHVRRALQCKLKGENPVTDLDFKEKIGGVDNQTIQEKKPTCSPPKSCMKKNNQQARTSGERHVRFELTVPMTLPAGMHMASISYTRKLVKSVSKFLVRLTGIINLRMGKQCQAIKFPPDPIY